MSSLSKNEAAAGPWLVFGRLRQRMMGNAAQVLMRRSLLRLLTILACGLVIWAFVFGLSLAGFWTLRVQQVPLAGDIVGTLFDLMFLALGLMLTFSTGIILYSSLFTSPEAAFLLSTPAPEDGVFAFKFQAHWPLAAGHSSCSVVPSC